MKKFFALVLLLPALAISCHTASAQGYTNSYAREAIDKATVDGVDYRIYVDGTVAIDKLVDAPKASKFVVPDRALCRGRMCDVVGICDYAFFRTDFTSVVLPEGLTFIGPSAFLQCEKLTEVTLPSSLNSVGSKAFAFCCKLKSIHCKNNVPPALNGDAFHEVKTAKIMVKVPKASAENYRQDEDWKRFKIKGVK